MFPSVLWGKGPPTPEQEFQAIVLGGNCLGTSSQVAWRGVVWHGVAWRGVAWRGVAWRGMAWRGVAWRSKPRADPFRIPVWQNRVVSIRGLGGPTHFN